MLMDINRLLEDISIRHACKNVDKYVADVEKAVGIKLEPADNSSLGFTWSEHFEWYTDALGKRDIILDYFLNQQKLEMFSIDDYGISGHYILYFTFKFHPENAV